MPLMKEQLPPGNGFGVSVNIVTMSINTLLLYRQQSIKIFRNYCGANRKRRVIPALVVVIG